ncbi:hypothetical protein Ciccas_010142 [Cichlidogyrus casuarinus]|uniref:Uncharacterized protein n=1 Tax=Cichlidogyrus casuarinus TaxID=1844966 RepID=A0ABD2PW10_9PLAT
MISSIDVYDGFFVLELLGYSTEDMAEFMEVVPLLPPAIPYFCGPHAGIVHLGIPDPDDEELITRPSYIPKYLPLQRNVHSLPKEAEYMKKGKTKTPQISAPVKINDEVKKARKLPAWAEKSKYRMSRVSIDPITRELTEHGYCGKVAEASPDFAMIKRYRRVAPISKAKPPPSPVRHTDDFDFPINESDVPDDKKSIETKPLTDAEWDAVLKTDAPNSVQTAPIILPPVTKPKIVKPPPPPPPPGFIYKKVRKGSRWVKKLVKIPVKKVPVPKPVIVPSVPPSEFTEARPSSLDIVPAPALITPVEVAIEQKPSTPPNTGSNLFPDQFLPQTPVNSGSPVLVPPKSSLLDDTPSPLKAPPAPSQQTAAVKVLLFLQRLVLFRVLR